MKLFIQNPFQDTIEIDIPATAKVEDIKKVITTKINGLMNEDLILKYRSKTLNDSNTIQTSGIRANEVLELTQDKTLTIYVKTEENRIIQLEVHFLGTIEHIKKMLNRLLKLQLDQQQLSFNDKELKNEDMITEKFITRGTTINLKIINLNLQLNIVERSGKISRINITRNSTLTQLKNIILEKYQVPPHFQILTYNGEKMRNNEKSLADYNVMNLSEIHFRPDDIEITIILKSIGGDRQTLRVLPIDTIGDVKDKIQVITGINKNVQRLIWNGNPLVDNDIVSEVRINNGSTLILVATVQNLKLHIQVGPEDRVTIEVHSTETVAQLKTKLFNETKIPINQQILFAGNTKLVDTNLLINYGLNESADIVLERQDSFDLFIQSFTSRQIKIRVHKSDTINHVKEQIDRRLGIKPDHQRLLFGGQELVDDTLESYQIQSQNTIHLVSRIPGGLNILFGQN